MKFVDEINFYVSSGKSGNGSSSFSIKNKPDGGNGGRGGNVYLVCDFSVKSFCHLNFMHVYKAGDGFNGQKNRKTGKNGNNLFIKVPEGTLVFDSERNIILGELLNNNDLLLVVSSGNPGYGNFYFRKYTDSIKNFRFGSKSNLKCLYLQLNLLADIGLLGFPNVGKSSFICNASNSLSKISDYKFTTLYPILGILKLFLKNLILADIPGIILNSSNGTGLGFTFLKHLLKTQLLLNFFDLSFIYYRYSFYKFFFIINNELNKFNLKFLFIRKWVILNKNDLINDLYFSYFFYNFIKKNRYYFIFFISSKKKYSLKKLVFNINRYFFGKKNYRMFL